MYNRSTAKLDLFVTITIVAENSTVIVQLDGKEYMTNSTIVKLDKLGDKLENIHKSFAVTRNVIIRYN